MEEVSVFSNKRKPNGTFIFFDDLGNTQEFHSAQCCHCGNHWQVVKGSGRIRGWCLKCQKITCGGKDCHECVPFEARLEIIEGKRSTIKNYLGTKYVRRHLGLLKKQEEMMQQYRTGPTGILLAK